MSNSYLDKVYGTKPENLTGLYDDWAGDYDGDLTGHGYATPGRLARLLASVAPDRTAPLLDFGCGTGLSGAALAAVGFTTIDGCDVSQGMLEEAQAKRIYRNLWQTREDAPLPFRLSDYRLIAAVGVISTGAAPPEVLEQVTADMAPGTLFAFSYNDHTLSDPSYMDALDEVTESRAHIVTEELGDHIPGLGSQSRVYVLEIA
jgi:predicted TPR repeat methyltransferase